METNRILTHGTLDLQLIRIRRIQVPRRTRTINVHLICKGSHKVRDNGKIIIAPSYANPAFFFGKIVCLIPIRCTRPMLANKQFVEIKYTSKFKY